MAYPNIVLKDKSGKPNTFDGIDTIIAPGHNADGVAEDIIFKKFIEGAVASGNVQMSTGTFNVPPTATNQILEEWFCTYENKAQLNGDWWVKTISPSPCVITDGEKYSVRYCNEEVVIAEKLSSFSSYGSCVVLGNKFIVTGNRNDDTREDFLIIYQEQKNAITCYVASVGANHIFSEKYLEARYRLYIFAKPSTTTFEVVHGRNEKPDFALICPVLYLASRTGVLCAWGAKSSIADLFPDKNVSFFGTTSISGTSDAHPLDATYSDGYLYCPNDTTLAYRYDNIYTLPANVTYLWIAFWGLESLLPSDETT